MPPDDTEEIKNGQWMGVTVRSQGVGGKVNLIFKRNKWTWNLKKQNKNRKQLYRCTTIPPFQTKEVYNNRMKITRNTDKKH